MRIYNTLSRQKEDFVPIKEGEVRMYACGPTVYNFFHIGNARPLVVFDALRNYFEYRGSQVTFVQNFTDVDDKLINRAKEENTTVRELADRYIREYFTDAKALGVREASVHPRATENIGAIIELVATLIEKGHAYEKGGNVFFSARSFKPYGRLSRQSLDDLEEGARIEVDDSKLDPMDFVLWKTAKDGEISWDSPWGKGRPGWHIECSAMSNRFLGKTFDIHCGGQDLIFPHHENEIAQSEAANGVPLARYWMHNGFINVDNEKMSKSKGNFFTVRDITAQYDYEIIRFMMLSAHYRSPINFSADLMEGAKTALARIRTCLDNLDFLAKSAAGAEEDGSLNKAFSDFREKFIAALDDDFNTADAISVIFEAVRLVNSRENLSAADVKNAKDFLDELCGVLGIAGNKKSEDLDGEIEQMIDERQKARADKDWKRADELRDRLRDMGIILEDTPQGVKWRRG